jgi:hypothetical protein
MAPTATVSIEPCWSLILRRGRRGKYHELVSGILLGVESLADDSALIVALDGAGAMSIASLRSAINRATKSRKIPIGTFSDEKNFAFGRNLR